MSEEANGKANIDVNALIAVLKNQRNAAQDQASMLEAYVATLQAEIAQRNEAVKTAEPVTPVQAQEPGAETIQ